MAVDGERQVVWAGLGADPEREAVEIAGRYVVPAATLVAGGADSRKLWLGLQVAVELSRRRSAGGLVGSCLTCWSRPLLPAGMVRVPHLVSIRRGVVVRDVVVWELSDADSARDRVGLPADWEFFEAHLAELLRLRARLRAGRLPAGVLARRVVDMVGAQGGLSGELSIEVVYRHADLFRQLLGTMPGQRRNGRAV